jgi:hypothetical protein
MNELNSGGKCVCAMSEVLKAMIVDSAIFFWDVRRYSLVEVYRRRNDREDSSFKSFIVL